MLQALVKIQAHKVADHKEIGDEEISVADFVLTKAIIQMYQSVEQLQQVVEKLAADDKTISKVVKNPDFKDPHKPDSIQGAVNAIDNKYGYCPKCGSPGRTRERRPNGNDRCYLGHVYPSRTALEKQPERAFIKKTGPASYYLGKGSSVIGALQSVDYIDKLPAAIIRMAGEEWEDQINYNNDYPHDYNSFTVEDVVKLLADKVERLQNIVQDLTRKQEWDNGV